MKHRKILLLLLLATLALTVAPTDARADRLVEQRSHNFALTVPDEWVDLPFENQWKEHGIVYGAARVIKKLENGEEAKGQGGWLHVAVSDAPEDKDIDAIAADPEVQSFMTARFGDAGTQVQIIPADFDEGLPLRVLVAEGTTRNLRGNESPTRAVMLLTVAQGKLIKTRMYAWTSEYDDEGLKADLDVMEMNFDVIDKTLKKPAAEGPPPEALQDPTEEEVVGDEDEVKVFENRALGWKVVKPKGIASKEWDMNDPRFENIVAWFEGNRPIGSYQVIFYVIRRGRIVDGRQVPDEDLKKWALDGWWARFNAAHPKGDIAWWKWPRRSKTFLVLPDFSDDEARKVIEDDPDKRPIEADARDLMKKLKIAEDVKNQDLGDYKTIEAYRANMEGNRPTVGREIVMRYTWGTSRLTCMIVVSLTRDAHKKWEKPINELLGSVEMTKD